MEQERGATENALRRCKRFTASLYEWLPEDKTSTFDNLDQAIAARQAAELQLRNAPEHFPEWVLQCRNNRK